MAGHRCYHCKAWVEESEAHDCWTTTEAALTADLSEDLRDAYERLRETAIAFGEQRIYASHHSIMFARKTCYVFVRPKRQALEVCLFLGRTVKAAPIRRSMPASKVKVAHLLDIRHRDEVEPPITDWMREAYQLQDQVARPASSSARRTTSRAQTTSARKAPAARPTRRSAQPRKKAR